MSFKRKLGAKMKKLIFCSLILLASAVIADPSPYEGSGGGGPKSNGTESVFIDK